MIEEHVREVEINPGGIRVAFSSFDRKITISTPSLDKLRQLFESAIHMAQGVEFEPRSADDDESRRTIVAVREFLKKWRTTDMSHHYALSSVENMVEGKGD